MSLRNGRTKPITDWYGLQTLSSTYNLGPEWWYNSDNIVVKTDGSAAAIRSPLAWNTSLATGDTITSAFDYNKQGGHLCLFYTSANALYKTTGAANTSIASGFTTGGKPKFLNVNNYAYMLHGVHNYFGFYDGTTLAAVGIEQPASAPSVSYVAGGSGSFTVGFTLSYAYMNSATGHVGRASAVSNNPGASAGSLTVRIPVTASAGTGVDKIVIFITTDGGAIRYLLTDSAGVVQLFNNTTGNIDISIANIYRNTQIEETASNYGPTWGTDFPYYMFKWKNRLVVCGFKGAATRPMVAYSAFESIQYGIPWECYPPQNAIYLPNKGDAARGGIETPVGALIFGEEDSYLIEGTLTDKVGTSANNLSLSEAVRPMGWSIGTRSPFTACTTPFGVMWLDQNKRLMMWTYEGFPVEPGLPIRNALATSIGDTDAIRNNIEGVWYQHGNDGGMYILTCPATSKQFVVTVYRNPETNALRFACSRLTLTGSCFTTFPSSGRTKLYMGGLNRLFEIMDLTTPGSGWGSETRFFRLNLGADDDFVYWHSLHFDAPSVTGLTVKLYSDGASTKTLTLEADGESGTYYAILDALGSQKTLEFTWATTDDPAGIIENLRLRYSTNGQPI